MGLPYWSLSTSPVSIAAGSNYTSVKTEGPTQGFSLAVQNPCAEGQHHPHSFDRQMVHSSVQFTSNTRTPPDSTYPESYKDSSQEVGVRVCVCACVCGV